MGLQEYKRKRDFEKTPEPAGRVAKGAGRSFVIQKHAATRLHYDFRLELEGVLKSWAVPKGPSLDPGERRLAVHVEDHPIDYGTFEGIIPKGQYGGGTVLLWDRGRWYPEGDAAKDYRRGKLKFRLEGEKLQGGFMLVRMHGDQGGENGENWLLIKEKDDAAQPGSGAAIVEERPESVATGQSLEEIAADPESVWHSNRGEQPPEKPKAAMALAKRSARKPAPPTPDTGRGGRGVDPAKLPGARKAPLPARLTPQLATLVAEPPRGPEWLHEIKYDGYRLLCEVRNGKVRLVTRNGKDWTDRFGPIPAVACDLPVKQALLDGEAVVVLPDGTTSFQALQNALGRLGAGEETELVFYAFDLLHQDGWDLRGAPLAERKAALAALLAGQDPDGVIRYSDHVSGQGEDFYRQACGFALEGVVSKRGDLPYRSGRGSDWLKVKCLKRQEFVIVGWTDPEGSRVGFGSLHLAVREEPGGDLVYAGKVGTGFDDEALRGLRKRLDRLARKAPAFAPAPRGAEARRSHWVEPELVAEVAFTEWTEDGVLRHPSFQGLREDKSAAEVVRERPQPAEGATAPGTKRATATVAASAATTATRRRKSVAKGESGPAAPPKSGGKRTKDEAVEIAGVRLTNPDKVLYPGQGLTKRDLALYYERIADWILPHLSGRPLTLVRCPEGQARQCFYQKHVTDQFPPSIARVQVEEGAGSVPYGAVTSLEGLIALVQMGVLELHVWGAHRDQVEKPDMMVFDLDPDVGLDWPRVVEGAKLVRGLLAELGLESFLKTTGGKGLHVVAPVARRISWDDFKAFSKAVADAIVAVQPDRYTGKLTKARRKGKIFIDYLRNGRGATSIVAYSTRSRPGAPVSTPLFWEELDDPAVTPSRWTVQNLQERLDTLKADPWKDFFRVRQSITAAARRKLGL